MKSCLIAQHCIKKEPLTESRVRSKQIVALKGAPEAF